MATAKSLCIQLDNNGDVIVIKSVGKGAKASAAYLADFIGGSALYDFVPLSGQAIVSPEGQLAGGFIQYGVTAGGGFVEQTIFHRVRCYPGSDGKLGEVDSCQDITIDLNGTQTIRPGHVVSCIPERAIH